MGWSGCADLESHRTSTQSKYHAQSDRSKRTRRPHIVRLSSLFPFVNPLTWDLNAQSALESRTVGTEGFLGSRKEGSFPLASGLHLRRWLHRCWVGVIGIALASYRRWRLIVHSLLRRYMMTNKWGNASRAETQFA